MDEKEIKLIKFSEAFILFEAFFFFLTILLFSDPVILRAQRQQRRVMTNYIFAIFIFFVNTFCRRITNNDQRWMGREKKKLKQQPVAATQLFMHLFLSLLSFTFFFQFLCVVFNIFKTSRNEGDG
jgi:hypothetical protein